MNDEKIIEIINELKNRIEILEKKINFQQNYDPKIFIGCHTYDDIEDIEYDKSLPEVFKYNIFNLFNGTKMNDHFYCKNVVYGDLVYILKFKQFINSYRLMNYFVVIEENTMPPITFYN